MVCWISTSVAVQMECANAGKTYFSSITETLRLPSGRKNLDSQTPVIQHKRLSLITIKTATLIVSSSTTLLKNIQAVFRITRRCEKNTIPLMQTNYIETITITLR